MSTTDHDHIISLLQKASSVVVTTHINPDGDGIGAALALQMALEQLGKTVQFECPSPIASGYAFLPKFEEIICHDDDSNFDDRQNAELLISCDCGDLARLGSMGRFPRATLINLDHHASNDRFGDLNIVDEKATCTGVVVKRLIDALGVELNKDMAICLYTTVVFDTGRFMHSNTTAETMRWTADLLDTGIDAAAINRKLTYTKSLHDLQIQQLGLRHLAVDLDEPRIAGIALDAPSIAETGTPEDWGDLVEIPRSLAGNEIAYLLREAPDKSHVRCSLRSNPPFEIGPVASRFGGGGHLQAAGCTIEGDLESVMADLLPALRGQL